MVDMATGNTVSMINVVMVVDIIMNVLKWKELENYTTENGLWAQSIVKWIVLCKNKSEETYQDRQVAVILTNESMHNAAFEIGYYRPKSCIKVGSKTFLKCCMIVSIGI